MPTFDARQRRIHRAQSAALLSTLNNLTCSEDELLTIAWAALETVPHWCFLPAKQNRELRLLCGALFLAPMIQCWIDGKRIQVLREVIGDYIYQAVMQYKKNATGAPPTEIGLLEPGNENAAPELASILLDAGNGVLLGAVQHPVIARLLQAANEDSQHHEDGKTDDGNGEMRKLLPGAIAQPIYTDALYLFDQIYPDGVITNVDDAATGQPA